MNAIGSDEMEELRSTRTNVYPADSVSLSCPFSAIVDKGQIFQTIMALKSEFRFMQSLHRQSQVSLRVWKTQRSVVLFRHLDLQMSEK